VANGPNIFQMLLVVNSGNSGVSGPNVTKIVHNVANFILFNEPELRYCNPFPNGSSTKEIVQGKTPFFDFNWLPWPRPLRNQKAQ